MKESKTQSQDRGRRMLKLYLNHGFDFQKGCDGEGYYEKRLIQHSTRSDLSIPISPPGGSYDLSYGK